MLKQRYFDHAATTPLNAKVLTAMLPFLKGEFGNPSNLYGLGRRASAAIKRSTEIISTILGCRGDEIIFTSSATEADNLAILGIARANRSKGDKIIVSQVEHKGILAVCDALEKEGFAIVRLPVKKDGLVDLESLKRELDGRTVLVSITYADSETGTIQPISEIAKIIRNSKLKPSSSHLPAPRLRGQEAGLSACPPYFHTDATQAAGYLDINTHRLGVDLMTISAHKIYGPKGIGALYVKKGVEISPLIYGGGQQGKLRSGTENVPGIVGFAEALRLMDMNKRKENKRLQKLRDTLEKGICKYIPKVVINGHRKNRLPNFLNVSILDVEGEALLLYLDELGIAVNTGSACNSQSLEPSYILTALGNPYEYVHGSIRFTFGEQNSMDDIRYVLKVLPQAVEWLRQISPLDLKLEQTKNISDPRAFIGGQTPHFLRKAKKN